MGDPRLPLTAVDPAAAAAPAPKVYRVGTLTYTRGALLQVVFWMLWGDFFFQLLESLPTITPLLLRWNGASDSTIALVSGTLSSIVSFLWYPFVGTQSDRHRGRWGRRRPFLLLATPPLVLSLLLLGAAKPAGAWVHGMLSSLGVPAVTLAGCAIAWISVCVVVFLLFNAYIVQVYACLIADVIPAEVMGRFSGLYRAVGALGSIVFNRWILGWAETHTFHVYALVALLFAGAFSLIVWNVKEGDYPPPPPKPPGGQLGSMVDYLRTSFSHRFFLNYFGVTFFYWASLVPLNFVVFFATQAGKPGYAPTLGLPLQAFGEVRSWGFALQIPVYFVVGWFADKFHPMRVAVAGMGAVVASYFGCYLFVQDRGSLQLWWIFNQISIAVYLGAATALTPRLFPRERYGQFVSANLIFGMVGLILTPPVIGALMEWLRDYRYAFALCGALNVLAFAALLGLHHQWQKLGGAKGYVPPEVGGAQGGRPSTG